MIVIVAKRQTGKTSTLIRLAHEQGGYIVCRSKSMAGDIANMARKMECNIAFPITYEEFIDKRYYGKMISKFYIDDADALLQSMTVVPIEAVTLTQEASDGR